MIYDEENRPVNNAQVYVDGHYRASSDIHGHFNIQGLKNKKNYTIEINKPGYEHLKTAITYTGPTYILYLRLISADQLLAKAEELLRKKDLIEVKSFLQRASDAGGSHVSIQYLRAILEFYNEQYQNALDILKELVEVEKTSPFLYLFIADLYQYYTDSPETAEFWLAQSLVLNYDPGVEQRLRDLKGHKPDTFGNLSSF
jgi:tetratricopeptide (TPR) repeat protein